MGSSERKAEVTWRQNISFGEREKRCYPGEESEEYHRDVEARHDKEVKNAVLENRPHKPGHARPVTAGPVFHREDDDANDGNKICQSVRVLGFVEQWTKHTGKCNL